MFRREWQRSPPYPARPNAPVGAAGDVAVAFGDKGKRVDAGTDGDGELGFAVTDGADVVAVDAKTGELTTKKVGTATVTATGKGNYTGTVKTTFKIVAATMTGRAHLQGSGWQPTKSDPDFYGTTGKSLRMEALSLSLPKGFPVKGSIQYRSHLQGKGWESGWKKDGATSGTTGQSRRIEAVQIRLTGDMAKQYDVWYRVHSQRFGWMGWAKNGAKAGTEGMSKRAEAVQVVLSPRGPRPPAPPTAARARATRRRSSPRA